MSKKEMTVGQYLRRYAFYASMAAILTLGITSCDDSKVEANTYDNVTTTLVETEPNKFEIESEEVNSDSTSIVVVKKLDGSLDTMDYATAKAMYGDKDPMEGYDGEETSSAYYNSHAGEMWFILYWSNYGYHLGRPYDTPIYRGYYSTPRAYSHANTTQSRVVSSRTSTVVSRTSSRAPISSSHGYGGGSFSSSRGYGG